MYNLHKIFFDNLFVGCVFGGRTVERVKIKSSVKKL